MGYGYLFFILLICLGFLGGLLVVAVKSPILLLFLVKSKLIIAVGLVAYVMMKSLFIKIPAPEGYRLKYDQAPELFEAIKKYQSDLETAKIHEVLITPELNAAIQQSPRLGIFGWQKNSLILGAELLMVLSPREVMAVIAHEMGHLSGNHAKFNGWIYRVRIGWMNILYTVANINAVARWVFGKFFGWYAPYFSAYSFALARANEYEADQMAAQVTSADALAAALAGTEVMSKMVFNHYWEQLERQAIHGSRITASAYTDLQQVVLNAKLQPNELEQTLQKAMKVRTSNDNTHPSLRDRSRAVDGRIQFTFDPHHSAAVTWLGSQFNEIMNHLALDWVEWNQARWKALRSQGKQAKKQLESLLQKAELSTEEWVEQAHIQLFLDGEKGALPTFKAIHQKDPNEPSALFHLGSALLERNNPKGLKLLHQLLTHEEYGQAAGQRLFAYYHEHDRHSEAENVLLQIEQNMDSENEFLNELSEIKPDDAFYQVEFDQEEQEQIKKSLRHFPGIKHLWVAGRRLKTRPNTPVYVLLFELHEDESEYEVFANPDHNIEVNGYYSIVNLENKKSAKYIRPHCVQIK